MSVDTRTAIITGAAGGLGRVVTRIFLEAGIRIAALDLDSSSLETLKADLDHPDNLSTHATDVTDLDAVESVLEELETQGLSPDILLNIAGGFFAGKSVQDTDVTKWDHMITLNLKSAFVMSKAVMPRMSKQQSGTIINLAALAALQPKANRAAYQVSKAGVIALTRSLAEEGKAVNVQVNAIAPSIILTLANKEGMPSADFSKWVTPKAIAQTMLHLCSGNADSITGSIVEMPGKL